LLNPWNRIRLLICRYLVAVIVAFAGSLSLCPGADAVGDLPFHPGEEVKYDVRWQMYKAGEARIQVLPFTEVKGRRTYHFQFQAQSNSFIDKLFKVRDRAESFVADDFSGSMGYEYRGEGKKKKEIRVDFFPETKTVIYSNFNKARKPLEIPEGCFDPVSSYFKMRAMDLVVGQTLSFPITDGKKFFFQKGEIVKKEKITLKSGAYDTVVVVPYVTHFSGVFKESKDPTVRVWLSDDERQIPVRIKIRIAVGSIYFDLRSYKPGRLASPPPAKGGYTYGGVLYL
jgi:hypothetical protein